MKTTEEPDAVPEEEVVPEDESDQPETAETAETAGEATESGQTGEARATDGTGQADGSDGDGDSEDSEDGEDGGGDALSQRTTALRVPPDSPSEPGEAGKTPPRAAREPDQATTTLRAPDEAARTGAVDQATSALRLPEQAPRKPVPPPPETPPETPAAIPPQAQPRVPPKPTAPPPPADAERDPLELLAALTNKPAPPPTPLRVAVRRVKIWSPLVALVVIALAIAQLLRPLPEPGLELTASESYTFEGETGDVPWPESGQAVLDVEGVGTFGSSGGDEAVPIASLAKVMTAYIILRDHPIKGNGDGESITIDQQAEDEGGTSDDQSKVEVHAGDELSERELLEAILIASANNVARLLARWDAGSEEAFVDKMNETAEELGMENTTYTDPSGLSEDTVSTAADQVTLAKAAMEDPVFREIVGVSGYTDSYGTYQQNWNYLVPVDGVVGIKTGTTTNAGGNLLFAAEQEVNGETQLIIGAVLGQPADPSDNSILTGALNAGKELIDYAQDALRSEKVFEAGDVVGYVDDGLGGSTPVVVTEDVSAVGWSGLEVHAELRGDADGVPHEAEAGTRVGTLTMGEPGSDSGGTSVGLALAKDLDEPGVGARLLRIV